MKAAKLGTEEVKLLDRISHLSDDLLLQILSLVTISDAMNTSLLSKRWKSLWKMMATLDYDEISCPSIGSLGFGEFCRRSLRLHEAPVLQTLTLKPKKYSDDWEELPCFPTRVFQKLVVLKLDNLLLRFSDYFSGKPPVCFRSLKSLHLTNVIFRGKEDFCRLTLACPVLEDLFLVNIRTGFRIYRSSVLTISVPSLQRFEIKANKFPRCSSDDCEFTINAPSLKYLNISDSAGRFKFDEDMMLNLVEARLGVDPFQTEKFLRFLTSVEFLRIRLYAKTVLPLADKISQQLLHLDLCIYGKISRNLLLHLLKHSPKLQVLKLQEVHWDIIWPTHPNTLARVRNFEDPPPSICNPSSVPECLSFHLHTFQWSGYEGREEVKEVVLYILQTARCLKTAAIYIDSDYRNKERRLMIKELKSIPKASTSCELVTRHR